MKINLKSPLSWLIAAAAISGSAILGALAFQHIGGYLPCAMCLQQRDSYYWGLPLLAVAVVLYFALKHQGTRSTAVSVLAIIVGLLFAYGTFLGIRHAGVEWRWWEGPGDCGMTNLKAGYDAANLLEIIQNTKVVSCTDAALRILGLSLAGWNAVVSFVTAILCGIGAYKALLYRVLANSTKA